MRRSRIIGLGLAGTAAAGAAGLGISERLFNRRVDRIRQSLEVSGSREPFAYRMLSSVPEPTRRHLRHAIRRGTPLASSATLTMSGEIRIDPDGPWSPLTAEEVIAPHRGFVWKAEVRMGRMSLKGADYYVDGKGRVRFSLFGLIPLVKACGPGVSRSAKGRLAVESVWVPSGFLPQQGVTWEAVDDTHAKATFTIDGEGLSPTLEIDREGRLQEVILPRWNEDESEYLPFAMVVTEEHEFDGYTIPTMISAGWCSEGHCESSVRFNIYDAQFR